MRYERKWRIPSNNFNKIINIISNYKIGFKKAHDDRYVNSIYFDTLSLDSVKENFYGLQRKNKFRVRWYGNKYIIKNPILEIKKKNGWINEKILISLKPKIPLKINNKDAIIFLEKEINNKLNLNKKIIPLVSTHYLRKYFVSEKSLIRITIDRFVQSGEFFRYNFVNTNVDLNNMVLEMKYEKKYDDYVKNQLDHNYIISKNSKFINSLFYSSHKVKI